MSGAVLQGIEETGVAVRRPTGDWLDAPLADLFHETMLALARTSTADPEALPQPKADNETSLAFRALRQLPQAVEDDVPPTIPAVAARLIPSRIVEVPAVETASSPLAAESAALSAHPHDVENIWTDIRALLDQFNSGSSIEMLDRRMQDLARKVDRQIGASSSALVEDLLRRIDTLQSSITGPIGDRQALDELLFCLDERNDEGRAASDDVQRLEEMMGNLAKRIEDVGHTSDPKDLTALHGQIERLSQRLEASEASLLSLDTIEHSLRDLFSELEQIRRTTIEAAETAARVAAQETLRAATDHPTVVWPSDPRPGLVERVAQDVEDLRHRHEASERRTQAALAGLHQAVEKLVERLGDPLAGGPIKRFQAPILSSLDGIARRVPAPAVLTEVERIEPKPRSLWSVRDTGSPVVLIEPEVVTTRSHSADADVFEGRLDPLDTQRSPVFQEAVEGLPSFIASARRAIQAAGASAAPGKKLGPVRAGRGASTSRALSSALTGLGRTRTYVELRRRPLMLTLAGLALLIGMVEIAQTEFGRPSSSLVAAADVVSLDISPATDDKPSPAMVDATIPGAPVAADVTGSLTPAVNVTIAPPHAAVEANAAMTPKTEAETSAAMPPLKEAAQRANPFLAERVEGFAGLSEGLKAKALAGDPSAEYEIGLRFVQGRTVARDPSTAATWFEKAAAHGSAPAQYRLGLAFEKGVGKPRDANLAMSWYARAAEAGNMRAIHNLAVMTAEGAVGKPDYVKAAALFEKAAGYGVKDSQFNLGMLYARGLGVAQNRGKSYTWFALAAAQGDDDAATKRDEVAGRLDPKALEAAKAAVQNFRVTPRVQAANDVPTPPGGWDAVPVPAQSNLSGQKASPMKSSMLGPADPG